jgi:uncharacterized protein (DUF1778 family)
LSAVGATQAALDQTVFELPAEDFEKLQAILDDPPEPNDALKGLMGR